MDERDLRALRAEIERLEARLAAVEDRPAARLSRLLARIGSSRRGRFSLGVAVTLVAAGSYAAQISVPNTFSNGTVADATEVNANFSALVTESNSQDTRLGAVENGNLLGILPPASGGTGTDTSATAAGSILYTSATGTWATLSPGSDGQVLKMSGGIPTWSASP
jgi:hypothetical protein